MTGLSATYGVAANPAGGLPTPNTVAWAMYNGQQPVGGFGWILGAAYVRGVGSNGAAVTLPNTVTLLNTANTQIVNTVATSDSQIAKFYFANGTVDGAAPAVAPAGSIEARIRPLNGSAGADYCESTHSPFRLPVLSGQMRAVHFDARGPG